MIFRTEPRKCLSQPLRSTWLKAKEGITEVNKIPKNGKISSAVFNELILLLGLKVNKKSKAREKLLSITVKAYKVKSHSLSLSQYTNNMGVSN